MSYDNASTRGQLYLKGFGAPDGCLTGLLGVPHGHVMLSMYDETDCMVCKDPVSKNGWTCADPVCYNKWNGWLRIRDKGGRQKACEYCGLLMGQYRDPQGNIRTDTRKRFCNRQCRSLGMAWGTKEDWEREQERRKVIAAAEKDGKEAKRQAAKQKQLRQHMERRSGKCVICMKKFYRINGFRPRWSRTCCDRCEQKRVEIVKRNTKRNKAQQKKKRKQKGLDPSGHRARARHYGVPYQQGLTNRSVAIRDDWTCGICGEPINPQVRHPHPQSFSLDHRVPLSHPLSPGHVASNVQASHLGCNVSKGAKVDDGGQLWLC